MAKTIVVLSDGTGNSSAALFKTNVWRVYEAIDQSPPAPDHRRQIAYYDDGVGTSAFKPLAILGGVFGIGLKRNILDLYRFVCRTYSPGDQIYLFGFSRGAFTIRLLAGLIATQGLVVTQSQVMLERCALDAYRAYRRRFNPTGGLVNFFRKLRDGLVAAGKVMTGRRDADPVRRDMDVRIRFVGVWDTVAAYGMPIQELTRGIDKWIWPLSMPNYQLSPKVDIARHALALDDERDTFHPLVWDEAHERELTAAGTIQLGRLRQVWFAGMHSDVGGGYPDDALSYVSLDWMLREACDAGLRIKPYALAHIAATANPYAPMHDSRRGFGGYYRYQPRRIDAWLRAAEDAAIMRNPNLSAGALLETVVVHASVLARIREGVDGYAPLVLPERFHVLAADGAGEQPCRLDDDKASDGHRESVWNDVSLRRANYFATVGVSLVILAMPAYVDDTAACIGPQCLLSPLIGAVGSILPGFLEPWTASFVRSPGLFLLLVVALALLLGNAGRLQVRIRERMGNLWRHALAGGALQECDPVNAIYRLRTSRAYQAVMAGVKWKLVPNAVGIVLLLCGVAVPLLAAWLVYVRTEMAFAEHSQAACSSAEPMQPAGGPLQRATGFDTRSPCWATGFAVTRGRHYRIVFAVTAPWRDSTIAADPRGFGLERMPASGFVATVLRRSITDPWLRPMLKIEMPSKSLLGSPIHGLNVVETSSGSATYYVAEFEAGEDGNVVLFVNDALKPAGDKEYFYANNAGGADVCMEQIVRDGRPPRQPSCLDPVQR